MDINAAIDNIKGVGEKMQKLLNRLNIYTIADLLYYLPKSYKDFGSVKSIGSLAEGEEALICATVGHDASLRRIRKNLSILKFDIFDQTGSVNIYFFNQPYIKNAVRKGQTMYFMGVVKKDGFGIRMDNPSIEKSLPLNPILPVYRLTAGITQKYLRKIIENCINTYMARVKETFSEGFLRRYGLCNIDYAIKNIHFPKDMSSQEQAKKRLVFEELILFCAMLDTLSGIDNGGKGLSFGCGESIMEEYTSLLPFVPTNAQIKAMKEIMKDYKSGRPQNRLIQGDVGSGKTMLAFFAMYICVKNGCQCALMAPTEVLARQHFETAFNLFKDTGIIIELMTGSKTPAQKLKIKERLVSGQADMLIGTHALLYDNAEFLNLGLIITDEQHRFGVRQRAGIAKKGGSPHIIIMSATPIPRTLALILYGKTDISVVDEMPRGRLPVKTHYVPYGRRRDMYGFIKKEIEGGSQAYVVCPLIEANEEYNAKSAEEIYEELKEIFAGKKISLLHGKMKAEEKASVMEAFKKGGIKLLVSTTVIEVGVDVKNATVMVVENAECFGLSQLHQLRGRVGRGNKPSYCFFTSQGGEKAFERINILVKSNDGFYIAEKDLEQRGPGEFLGTRQNGVGDLYMVDMIKDIGLLKEAKSVYEDIKRNDTDEFFRIREAALKRFSGEFEEITMN